MTQEKSLSLTKTMVLEDHFWYDNIARQNCGRKVVKINGSGWSTSDFFKDFYAINEAEYVEAQEYTEIDFKQLTPQALDHTCFVFNGINQVISIFISTCTRYWKIILFFRQ
jgi:hypothetical protein